MELYPGFVFRFKILPFLKKRVLPLYEEQLRKEASTIILSDEEKEHLQIFSKFLTSFMGRVFEVQKEVNLYASNILFETLKKCLFAVESIFYKVTVSEDERQNILTKFCPEMIQAISFLLS